MEEQEELKTIRRDFSESTSCHGIGQMYSSKSKCQKAFWCILVLIVFGMLVSQLTFRIQAYLAYKTTTSITEKYNTTLEMPAITVCNFNSFFDVTTKNETEAIRELSKANSNIKYEDINYQSVAYFDGIFNGSIREYVINKGWNLTKSLLWCRYGTEECSANNFTYTIGEMGKCWTYKPPRSVDKAGSKSGFHMVFDIYQDDYTENYVYGNWEAGVKVQIHPDYNVPEVDELGLSVPVGTTGFITIKMIEEKLMYQPWGQCKPDNEKLRYFETYSRANCFNQCYRDVIEEECKCRLYYFDQPTNLSECNPNKTIECLHFSSGWLKPYLTPERCGCQPPCQSKRYESAISYGTFPNSAIHNAVAKERGNASKEYMSRNLVGFYVYFEILSSKKLEEDKQITWSALLSDLGGQLGLWIGISVVTIFEFAQFLAFHINVFMRNKKSRKKDMNTGNTDTRYKSTDADQI